MDRFSEESTADLARFFRLNSRCFRDEDGIPDGDYEPLVKDEPEDYEPPYQPLCRAGARIVELNFQTVKLYLAAMDAHKATCAFCRGEGRKETATEHQAVVRQPPRKAA